jgi:hypothetical protein
MTIYSDSALRSWSAPGGVAWLLLRSPSMGYNHKTKGTH